MEQTSASLRLRRRDEKGASLVEFALIVTLLSTLLLGIVIFGLLLSKRQVLTQAVAEGARSAVPVSYTALAPDNALNAARTKTNQSLEALGDRQCPLDPPATNVLIVGDLATNGIRCTFMVFDCAATDSSLTDTDANDCIEVKVEVDVNSSPAIVPGSNFIDPLLPDIMTGRSVVGLSGIDA